MIKLFAKLKAKWQKLTARPEKVDIIYPISWETMTEQDFKNVCIILTRQLDRHQTLFLCLCKLADIYPDNASKYDKKSLKKGSPFIINGKPYVISTSVISEACNQMAFIFDKIGLPPSPFKNVDRMLYGVSFETFYEVDSYIMRSIAEGNEGYLKHAAKALTNGAKRKLLPWERKALVIWWNGVKEFLKGKYPHVLTSDGGGITDKSQADILHDLLGCLNDNKPQENDRILKCEVHSVLYSLDKIYKNAKHQSAQ